jgi:hypothetical protein
MTSGVRAFALGLMILSTGCTRAPASAPQAQAISLATRSEDAQGGADGMKVPDAESAPLFGAGARATLSVGQGAAQGGGAGSPALASAGAIEETRTVKAWFCFSWVHGRDFASPCFSNAHACAQAFAKDAHQDKKKCSEYSGTVTCVPSGGDDAGARDKQRCFQ